MSIVLWVKKKYYLFNKISNYLDLYFDKIIEFFKEKSSNSFFNTYIYIIIFSLLTLIATFRPPGMDRDWFNYERMIKTLLESDVFWLRSHEISFSIIVHFADRVLHSPITGTFFIYATLGLGIKLFVIRKKSIMPLFSIFVYICIFFINWEMTQIRVAVAVAFFLYAIPDIYKKRPFNYFLKAAFAYLFHYSALMMIPFYFLRNKRPNRYIYMIMPVIVVIFGYLDIGVLILTQLAPFLPQIVGQKLIYYLVMNRSLRVFAPYFLSKVLILYYCFIFLKNFTKTKDFILIKIYAWAIIIFYMLSLRSIFAVRVFEFLSITEIFLFPSIIMASGRKAIMTFLFISYLFMTLFYQFFVHCWLDFSILFKT